MSNKSVLKFVVAFGILAVVLIFLGVNFVPRIYASVSSRGNGAFVEQQFRPNYTNELYPRSIARQASFTGTDSILSQFHRVSFTGTDSILSQPRRASFTGTDSILSQPRRASFTGTDSILSRPSNDSYALEDNSLIP